MCSAASPSENPIRVLVIDDDHFVRIGIAQILSSAADITVVGDIDDGDQAVATVERLRPDVVLMDIHMRRMDGIAATELLRGLPDPPEVVVMTALAVDDHLTRAIAAGAHSFLSKDEAPEAIVRAIRVVAAGYTVFSPASLRALVDAGLDRVVTEKTASDLGDLTEREREVLARLASGLSNAEVGRALYLEESTVKTHVSAVLAKLGARNRVEAALTAFRAGLVD